MDLSDPDLNPAFIYD